MICQELTLKQDIQVSCVVRCACEFSQSQGVTDALCRRKDVESYIYMPLLEEMQYMPKHKYASGEELREYAERICGKYGLFDRAMFQSKASNMVWDDVKQEWKIEIRQNPKGLISTKINVSADFVILASGVLDNAKLPDAMGIEDFQGDMFHTARWHYDVTGGRAGDPDMTRLRDKKVGIIGTGRR